MNKNASLCVLCGMATGALIGLLYAPHSGARTRRKINAKARETGRILGERVADLGEDLASGMERAGDTVRRSTSSARELLRR